MKARTRTKKVIKFRPELFWDVDPKTIDPKKHARYIIERILDFGYDDEVKWVWHFYSHDIISRTVKDSRVLFPQTRSLWRNLIESK